MPDGEVNVEYADTRTVHTPPQTVRRSRKHKALRRYWACVFAGEPRQMSPVSKMCKMKLYDIALVWFSVCVCVKLMGDDWPNLVCEQLPPSLFPLTLSSLGQLEGFLAEWFGTKSENHIARDFQPAAGHLLRRLKATHVLWYVLCHIYVYPASHSLYTAVDPCLSNLPKPNLRGSKDAPVCHEAWIRINDNWGRLKISEHTENLGSKQNTKWLSFISERKHSVSKWRLWFYELEQDTGPWCHADVCGITV